MSSFVLHKEKLERTNSCAVKYQNDHLKLVKSCCHWRERPNRLKKGRCCPLPSWYLFCKLDVYIILICNPSPWRMINQFTRSDWQLCFNDALLDWDSGGSGPDTYWPQDKLYKFDTFLTSVKLSWNKKLSYSSTLLNSGKYWKVQARWLVESTAGIRWR